MSATAAHIAPAARRIERLDALRGLALLGILQINIQAYCWGAGEVLGYLERPLRLGESLLYFLQAALIEGKFYPIFAFLFGVGMALQLRKLQRLYDGDRAASRRAHRRRLYVLFVLGMAHGLLLFSGDVLSAYAACGLIFLAIAPARLRDLRRLTIVSGGLAAASLLLPLLLEQAPTYATAGQDPSDQAPAVVVYAHEIYTEAGFIDQLGQRRSDEIWQQVASIPTFWPQVFALISLGMLAGRLGWLRRPSRHRRIWQRAGQLGLGLGLPLSLVGAAASLLRARAAPGSDSGWDGIVLGLGSLLAAAYVAAAVRAFDHPRAAAVQSWFAAAGRLSLSNYVGQSLALAALLSGGGLGWGAQASRAQLALLGLAIFGAQLAISRWILQHFAQGPLEALWRLVTYGGLRPRQAKPQGTARGAGRGLLP